MTIRSTNYATVGLKLVSIVKLLCTGETCYFNIKSMFSLLTILWYQVNKLQTYWRLSRRWCPWWRTMRRRETHTPRCGGQRRMTPMSLAGARTPTQWLGCESLHSRCPTASRIGRSTVRHTLWMSSVKQFHSRYPHSVLFTWLLEIKYDNYLKAYILLKLNIFVWIT